MTDCKNCNYTDEYCASGECTSQLPRNGSQKGDLTSQWHKGELPNDEYYVVNKYNVIEKVRYCKEFKGFCDNEKDLVKEVLAEVPDYVEWKQAQERLSKLEKMQYSYTPEEWNIMLKTVNHTREENDNLKKIIGYMIDELVDRKNGASLVDYFSHDLIDEIMEALK